MSGTDVWQEAHDRAIAALRDLREADLARIGAAVLELRLAGKLPCPTAVARG